jgi:hypothetical protein
VNAITVISSGCAVHNVGAVADDDDDVETTWTSHISVCAPWWSRWHFVIHKACWSRALCKFTFTYKIIKGSIIDTMGYLSVLMKAMQFRQDDFGWLFKDTDHILNSSSIFIMIIMDLDVSLFRI